MRRLMVLVTLVGWAFPGGPALPHSFYDPMCCSDKDCRPIADDDIKPTKNGWLILQTGETVPYKNPSVKHSPDGRFHRCTISGDFSPKGHTLCLYVPDQVN